MNRRSFFKLGLGAAVAAAAAPVLKLLDKRSWPYKPGTNLLDGATATNAIPEAHTTIGSIDPSLWPPQHPNCRCVAEPIVDDGTIRDIEAELTRLWANCSVQPDTMAFDDDGIAYLEAKYGPCRNKVRWGGVWLVTRGRQMPGNAKQRRAARRECAREMRRFGEMPLRVSDLGVEKNVKFRVVPAGEGFSDNVTNEQIEALWPSKLA